jgi:hypothetical protein
MLMVLGLLVAIAPVAIVLALFAWAGRRERIRRDVQALQVALTDAVHEHLGAVASPVVRRRRRGWQVTIAVPFERTAMTESLLAIVLRVFTTRESDRRLVEIVLTRLPDPAGTKLAAANGVRWESSSWT